ncbi:helix-turn-helix transcriptional regulator [Nocardioides massiliensis]|uniref:helix-turn-helix transcriptional regulator n=1 Tax=Nocardioides massiliensis TaxID=1325935 RepID=UPI003520A05F
MSTVDDRSATDRTELLLSGLESRRALLLTGDRGSGKTYLLRAASSALGRAGRYAPMFSGSGAGATIPLGAFTGAADLPEDALSSPAAIIDAFSRRRTSTVLIVDDVDCLDEASLHVVVHLVATTRLPAILGAQDLTTSPGPIRRLYDSGDLSEWPLAPLSDGEAAELVRAELQGDLTPTTLTDVLTAGRGNPLHLREVIRGSVLRGRLVETEHGWDLRGTPVPTPRLAQLVGERFEGLDQASLDAATLLAIARELPAHAIGDAERRALARADVIEPSPGGWVGLSHPLDAEYLRSRCSTALWHEFVGEVVAILRKEATTGRPRSRRQAELLALDHDLPVDVDALLGLAEHALGAFDERLALRAATAVIATDRTRAHAHRIAGMAASVLGMEEDALASAADEHFATARDCARSDPERTAVALAHAEHLALRRHDGEGALAVLRTAEGSVDDPECLAHLQSASVRWSMVAGMGGGPISAPDGVSSPESVVGLITAGVSGVIAGPLQDAVAFLPRLRDVPDDLVAMVPGGSTLIDLTASMALSYTGDVLATRARLEQQIAAAQQDAPEDLGVWEYALGFLELLSADAVRAYELGRSAAAHLAWRDSTGLHAPALALTAAAATATDRPVEARKLVESIPEPATADPKVVMLSSWSEAWQLKEDRRPAAAAERLMTTAQWLLDDAQHTFFGGMTAHCAARLGHQVDEAADVLRTARSRAGGGLLRLLTRHADAMSTSDVETLDAVAADARELGVVTTAADTWAWMARSTERTGGTDLTSRRYQTASDALRADVPGMALWSTGPPRPATLTERERQVADLAARRYTSKEIAELNGVSVNTVTNQLASAFRKLGVSSRAELREVWGTDG